MIDLSSRLDALTDDERVIRDAAAAYFSRHTDLKRVRALRAQRPSHDPDVWRELAQMGWLGALLPERFGGSSLSRLQATLVFEQFGRSLAPEPLTAAAILAGGVLLGGTNEALSQRYLPALAKGEWLPSLAWQEHAGQQSEDSLNTRAIARGSGVVLNGIKRFVWYGESAHAFIVSADGPEGLGLYLVERDSPGLVIDVRPRIDGGTWSELHLEEVAVSDGAVIASGGVARTALERALDDARLAASAELVGLMSHAFELTVDYLKLREQFGRPIGSFQALQHRAVDLLILVELARSVLYLAARRFDAATDAWTYAKAASQVKARTSDAALKVVKGCIQLHGGIGYTDAHNIGLFLKRAMVLAVWLGGPAEHRGRYGRLVESTRAEGESTSPDPLRAGVRSFLAEHFPPEWRFPSTRMSLKETETWQRKLADMGWIAPGWPKEYGGMGLSMYEQLAMQDEFDRYGISIFGNQGVGMLGPLLIRYGTAVQKQKYLPDIVAGRVRWCQGYSEQGAGSDLASVRTRAVLDGEYFVVNGQKIWTTYAHEADMMFMLVRTDQQVKKQEGISFLLVDMRSEGITVRQIMNLTGQSEFCEVFFDNVRVPRDNLVGEVNKGWTMAKTLLGSERIGIGSPRRAGYPLQLLRGLIQSQGRLDDPVARSRLDELRLDVDDLSAMYVRMGEVLRHGGELGAEVSMLKIWITETMQRVTDMMLEFQAEQGTVDEAAPLPDGTSVHVAGQYFLSRPATIYGGTSEIQRNILAKAILELPN